MKRRKQPKPRTGVINASAIIPTANGNKTITASDNFIWKQPLNIAIMVVLVIGICTALWYMYNFMRRYLLSKDVEPQINFIHPENPTVGETLTCRVRFKKKGGKIIPSTVKTFRELQDNIVIVIQPASESLKHPIAVLQEFDSRNSSIAGKFSLRKSGSYEIKVKYNLFYLMPEKPFIFDVSPGPVSPKYMDFDTHNPHILCLTAGAQQYFKISAEDEYGNKCRVQDVELGKLSFQILELGNSLPVEHEFCYHKFITHGNKENAGSGIDTCAVHVCLKIKLNEPGVYTCFLKYGDYEVRGTHGVPKLLVCISPEEENELRDMYSQISLPGTLIYSSECKLSFVGDEDGFKDYYVGISAKSLVFALYRVPLRLYPDASFPINARTKIMHYSSQTTGNNEMDSLTFLVQDGLRLSVRLTLPSSPGRMLLVVFAHNQGFLFPKLRTSFMEKRESLKNHLSSYFFWFTTEKVLQIDHANFIQSTLKEVPTHSDDWLIPFRIEYRGGPPSTDSREQDWINRLCEEFFNGQGETAMFQRLQGSKLLHPVSSTISHQPVENYKLAGQILAKAIVETLLRGICTNLSQVRLTRSMLAFILGCPITFKFLESDEPKYFRKMMQIAESDLDEAEQSYAFTTCPSSTSDTNIVNLIPNGSDIPVTNVNKEHYLNLLTNHRLIHTIEQEISAFRNGFYEVIDKDKLSDFQDNDLQKLISAGCGFNIMDLKRHHRVVKEVDNGNITAIRRQSMDTKKLLNWFWTACENLSEEEQSHLIFFVTGSFSLPSCGLGSLNPIFTISLTGTFNQPPKAHSISNEIVLADHTCFQNFERSLLYAIKPESERIMLPTSDMMCLQGFCGENADEQEEMEEGEGTESTGPSRTGETSEDPVIRWLRGLIDM